MFNFEGKVALITGGGSGIGQATALKMAQQGAKVAILELNEQAATETVDLITNNGGTALAVTANVTQLEQVEAAVAQIEATLGEISILVNSAGIAHVGNLGSTTGDDFDRLYQVNIKGSFHTMKAVLPTFLKNNHGVILNLASIASVTGIPDRLAYSMTKGAVLSMTLSIARDYIDKGIRCNCIAPARVHTPFVDNFIKNNYPGREQEMFDNLSKTQPIGRMAKPDEIAALILYLCSDEASFITGCNYPIDGGFIYLK